MLFFFFCSHLETVNLIDAENGFNYSLPTRIYLPSRVKMVEYKVTIQTGNRAGGSTINSTYIKLVGTDGESGHTWAEGPFSFATGPVSLKHPFLNVKHPSSALPS